jgi:hypothetical protein
MPLLRSEVISMIGAPPTASGREDRAFGIDDELVGAHTYR